MVYNKPAWPSVHKDSLSWHRRHDLTLTSLRLQRWAVRVLTAAWPTHHTAPHRMFFLTLLQLPLRKMRTAATPRPPQEKERSLGASASPGSTPTQLLGSAVSLSLVQGAALPHWVLTAVRNNARAGAPHSLPTPFSFPCPPLKSRLRTSFSLGTFLLGAGLLEHPHASLGKQKRDQHDNKDEVWYEERRIHWRRAETARDIINRFYPWAPAATCSTHREKGLIKPCT